jgi:hypothetical protein
MLALQLERTGIPEVRRLLELAQFLQLHREVAGRFLSRQPGQAEAAARLCAWVSQQLARRPRLAQDAGIGLDWRRLASAVENRVIDADASDARHAELIARCLSAAEAMAEESGMAQDCAGAPVCGAIGSLRDSLSAPKLAIEAQLRACYRGLEWLDGVLGRRLSALHAARRAA